MTVRALPFRSLCLVAVLTAALGGCVGGPRVAARITPPDPPPIPARKPDPPAAVAQAARQPVARAATAAVVTAPLTPVRSPPAAPKSSPTVGDGIYTVRAGDTVYGIGRMLDVPLRSVIDANGLRPPYVLKVGERLRIPRPRRHIVQKGDTVYGISRRYGVDMTELVRLNRIGPPYAIAVGQGLILPVPGGPRQARVQLATRPRPPTGDAGKPSRSGQGVAARKANLPAQPAKRIDGGANVAVAPAPPPAAIAPAAIPQPPPRAGGKFLWPVRGKIMTSYGPKRDGLHNDGINVAAPRGTAVHAAENGVVVYVGNELRGFGNLVLVRHAGGWVTAYAHADTFLVRRGEVVKRGQPIARVGSSGNVSSPQLHFEIRKGTRAVDPLRLLGRQRAAAD